MKQLSIIYLIICSILLLGVILISMSPQQPLEIGQPFGEDDDFSWSIPDVGVTRIVLLGSNSTPKIIPLEVMQPKSSGLFGTYFFPGQKNLSRPDVLFYKNIYRNIDLKIYENEKEKEHNWIINPGGSPGDIRFTFENIKSTRIDMQGNLVIEAPLGKVIHKRPISYQFIAGKKRAIKSAFNEIEKDIYGFTVETYDKQNALFIEPVVLVEYSLSALTRFSLTSLTNGSWE